MTTGHAETYSTGNQHRRAEACSRRRGRFRRARWSRPTVSYGTVNSSINRNLPNSWMHPKPFPQGEAERVKKALASPFGRGGPAQPGRRGLEIFKENPRKADICFANIKKALSVMLTHDSSPRGGAKQSLSLLTFLAKQESDAPRSGAK